MVWGTMCLLSLVFHVQMLCIQLITILLVPGHLQFHMSQEHVGPVQADALLIKKNLLCRGLAFYPSLVVTEKEIVSAKEKT